MLASAAAPSVVLVKSSATPPFEVATSAITGALQRDPPTARVTTVDLGGDEANGQAALAEVRRLRASLVVTVGSLATSTVLADPDRVPVVFSMVLYPEASGFVPGARPVTGTALDLPVEVQFAYLHRLLPAAHRIGVLYHRAETGAVIDAARAEAPHHGFTLEAREIADPKEVLTSFTALLEQVDA